MKREKKEKVSFLGAASGRLTHDYHFVSPCLASSILILFLSLPTHAHGFGGPQSNKGSRICFLPDLPVFTKRGFDLISSLVWSQRLQNIYIPHPPLKRATTRQSLAGREWRSELKTKQTRTQSHASSIYIHINNSGGVYIDLRAFSPVSALFLFL